MNIALRHNLMKNTPQREGHAKAVRGAARNCGVEEELHASASRRSGRALAVEVAVEVEAAYGDLRVWWPVLSLPQWSSNYGTRGRGDVET